MLCLRHTALTARAFSIETGWPPPELLVTVSITSGTRSRPTRAMSCFQGFDVHVALERMVLTPGCLASAMGRSTASAPTNSTLARVVSKWVLLGTTSPFLHMHAEEDAFGGATLVRRDHVLVAEDVLHGIAEAVEAAAAGVALVAFHDGGPLMRGHGAGAGVGQQVDEDVVGREQKQVVVRGAQQMLALFAGGPADGLNALDAERLDDGLDGHVFSAAARPQRVILFLSMMKSQSSTR